MLIWLLSLASAATPVWSVHADGSVQTELAGGLGGSVGVELPHTQIGLGLDGLYSAQGPTLLARPQLRLFPGAPDAASRGHLVLGAGVGAGPEVAPLAEVGVGLDLGSGPVAGRIAVAYEAGWQQPGRALLSIGVVGRPPAREPAPAPVVEAPRFDAAMVWVPGPVCAWLPPDEATSAWQSAMSLAELATVPTPGSGAAGSDSGAVPQGDLVIAAFPGDQVWVDDTPLDVAADGIAWSSREEGRATVRIVGGGREATELVAVSAEGTLWYAASTPSERLRITFPSGSSAMPQTSLVEVQQIASLLGDWSVEVWGSASPEGDVQGNIALGKARAASVADALEAAGVDPARITVLPPRKAPDGLPPEQQRAAVIAPILETP